MTALRIINCSKSCKLSSHNVILINYHFAHTFLKLSIELASFHPIIIKHCTLYGQGDTHTLATFIVHLVKRIPVHQKVYQD